MEDNVIHISTEKIEVMDTSEYSENLTESCHVETIIGLRRTDS